MTDADRRTNGVQAVRRATKILSAIARRSPSGLGLSELSRRTDLAHPTVRRILRCLLEEQFITQDKASKRYHLGPLIFEFGLCAPHQGTLARNARPVLERLAAATGDTAYLIVRSGCDAVCLDRVDGTFPIRVVTTGIGNRRPLGIGAAGLAILSQLEETEINAILSQNRVEYEHYGLDGRRIREGIHDSRRRGYGVTNGLLTPGVAGIGVVITTPSGSPVAGISLASTCDRILGDRLVSILRLLRKEVRHVTRQMSGATTRPKS